MILVAWTWLCASIVLLHCMMTHFFAPGMLKKVKKAAIAVAAATENLFLDVLIEKILTDLDDKINSFDYLVINEREEAESNLY